MLLGHPMKATQRPKRRKSNIVATWKAPGSTATWKAQLGDLFHCGCHRPGEGTRVIIIVDEKELAHKHKNPLSSQFQYEKRKVLKSHIKR